MPKHELSKIMASVKEMRAAAKQRGVKGYYKMNKTQLMAVVGGGSNTKSGATGNKRAQGIAKKSGAAVSFGADKLAAKYGVDKKTLVSGTRKALKKAEKANGGPLTPQQKRKVAAGHLSGATKVDRTITGNSKKLDRAVIAKASSSKSNPMRGEMDGRSKSSKQVKKNLAKTKMMREMVDATGESGLRAKSRTNARFTKNTSARIGSLFASSRSAPGAKATIKDSRKLSREMGLPDQLRQTAKPKRGGRKSKKNTPPRNS